MNAQPNVLFILSDQHNAKCLGHTGLTDAITPNLDSLAADGVRFSNAITQSPICTPSRVSFFSGQYCHNHGYYGLSGPNPRGLPSVIEHFRNHGYTTAALGKIHCPEYWIEDVCDMFHDTTGASIGGRSPEYASYLQERGLTNLEDHAAMNEFGMRGVQTIEGRPSKVSFDDGQEGWLVRKAVEFMQQAQKTGNPFFVHVSFPKPHQCYTPAQPFWDLYEEQNLKLPPNADNDDPHEAPHIKVMKDAYRSGRWTLFEPKTFEAGRLRKLHGYLGNISHVDHAVGKLMQWLDENNISDNTILVYSSDHGDYAAEHDLMEKAPGICHDAITRVPSIWRWPKHFKSGYVSDELVENIDVGTTLTGLCGLPELETSDGRDIGHLLRGEKGPVRDIAVTEFSWSKSIRKGDWRLVWYPKEMFAEEYPNGYGQLYNLKEDPWEKKNRYFDTDCLQIIEELQSDLLNWMVTTARPVTTHTGKIAETEQTITRYKHTVNYDWKYHYTMIPKTTSKNYL
jgi:arylsulfatase